MSVPEHLQKYVQYIQNTGHDPLPVAYFDEDWEPIGPNVRWHMERAGLITISTDGIRLNAR